MGTVETNTLKNTIEKHIPDLQSVLAEYAIKKDSIDDESMLYMRNCGLGTAALQRVLEDVDGITTDRLTIEIDKPRDRGQRRPNHAILKHGDVIIDPTANQFLEYIGLTAEHAKKEGLEHLYPTEKVWVLGIAELRDRVNMFAEHAYTLDQQGLIPKSDEYTEGGVIGALRGKSLEEMREVYQSIWDIDSYEPLPVDSQQPLFTKIGHHMVERTKK